MTTVRTTLGLLENARKVRFEPTGSISQTNVQKAIEQVSTQVPAISGTNVTSAQSPYTVQQADSVIFVDCSGGVVEIDLPLAASRGGKVLEILDLKGNAASNNITVKPTAPEDIDGYTGTALKISDNYGGLKLYPRTAGYKIAA